jgi:NAD(P)-dependent dehydrogenase (short-subunit alcohol dehydrogenase family)
MTGLFDLHGRTAVVTGSSRGIGRAIALELATHGAQVVISSRKQDACDAVAAIINSQWPSRSIAVAANIAVQSDLERLVALAHQEYGKVDILICNAASNPYFGPMAGITDEQFQKTFRNNVMSVHWLVKLVSAGMIERKDGVILVVSSIGGLRGSPVIGAYNITKAADMQLVRNLAVEYGAHNVRVNCIAPGLVRTDFARALWEDAENLSAALKGTPLSRIGEPEDVAGVAVFLASHAGRYITGQTIIVDGGATVTVGGV